MEDGLAHAFYSIHKYRRSHTIETFFSVKICSANVRFNGNLHIIMCPVHMRICTMYIQMYANISKLVKGIRRELSKKKNNFHKCYFLYVKHCAFDSICFICVCIITPPHTSKSSFKLSNLLTNIFLCKVIFVLPPRANKHRANTRELMRKCKFGWFRNLCKSFDWISAYLHTHTYTKLIPHTALSHHRRRSRVVISVNKWLMYS